MQTYDLTINEQQRAIILAALMAAPMTAYDSVPAEGGCGEPVPEEVEMLVGMFADIPALDDADPGVGHGLCY